MVRSKFTKWVWIVTLFAGVLTCCFLFLSYTRLEFFSGSKPVIFKVFFSFFFFYFISLLVFGELRNKAIKIVIDGDVLFKSGFCGLGHKIQIGFEEFDGYKISFISSMSGTYEFFYLIKDGKKVVKLSEFYHLNYKEMKILILNTGIQNLGIEKWDLLVEAKEIFA